MSRFLFLCRTNNACTVDVSLFHLLLQAFVGLVLYVMWTVCLFVGLVLYVMWTVCLFRIAPWTFEYWITFRLWSFIYRNIHTYFDKKNNNQCILDSNMFHYSLKLQYHTCEYLFRFVLTPICFVEGSCFIYVVYIYLLVSNNTICISDYFQMTLSSNTAGVTSGVGTFILSGAPGFVIFEPFLNSNKYHVSQGNMHEIIERSLRNSDEYHFINKPIVVFIPNFRL